MVHIAVINFLVVTKICESDEYQKFSSAILLLNYRTFFDGQVWTQLWYTYNSKASLLDLLKYPAEQLLF